MGPATIRLTCLASESSLSCECCSLGGLGRVTTIHENAPEAAGRLYLSLNGLATDLDTEHGGTDAN
jgi:hypothetical protein